MSLYDIDFIIEKLTELIIKEDIKEKQGNQNIYVKKISCYRDLITFFKQVKKSIDKY